jgi:hypothetical protein
MLSPFWHAASGRKAEKNLEMLPIWRLGPVNRCISQKKRGCDAANPDTRGRPAGFSAERRSEDPGAGRPSRLRPRDW